MESKNAKPETLPMDPIRFQSDAQVVSVSSENSNPNVSRARIVESPSSKSSESAQKVTRSKLNPSQTAFSPRNRIRERRFVVVKKKEDDSASVVAGVDCKCGAKNMKKCVCVAYETLRASHEEFFKKRGDSEVSSQNVEEEDEIDVCSMKRRREKVLEEARRSLPEYGKVMHLVKAFEKLTCFPFAKAKEGNEKEDEKIKKALKWELPGMSVQQQKCPEEAETEQVTWSSSFSPSELVLTATNLGLEQQPHASVSLPWDNNSVSSLISNGGRRSRRNSLDSSASMGSRISKKKQVKVTSLKPFKLRTEERGRMKEEELAKKIQEMTMENEKMRIPIAQGLPWTTDEPESLVKPHVKGITTPVDLKLHSDIRAMERAEFDYQVAEKMSLIEQYKAERKEQQLVAEEEELRRLRKELIPKAQPMPYFDRPFIPRRSSKHPTIPRDPKFHKTQHKRCCSTSSWSETGSYMSDIFYQQDL
ncbi:protein WVD2-like 4 [Brassica rapa]|uniref:TPX2 C-terminal domain-containing protein n=1 Tax=Brassica campestris TaxID=3711 RepID=M4C9Z8_BRACM|nr:protein WVD2-like 4 [Brassica rapa]